MEWGALNITCAVLLAVCPPAFCLWIIFEEKVERTLNALDKAALMTIEDWRHK